MCVVCESVCVVCVCVLCEFSFKTIFAPSTCAHLFIQNHANRLSIILQWPQEAAAAKSLRWRGGRRREGGTGAV